MKRLTRIGLCLLLLSSILVSKNKTVLNLNRIMTVKQCEELWPYRAASNVLKHEGIASLPTKDGVVLFNYNTEEVIKQIEFHKQVKHNMIPYSFSYIKESIACLYLNPRIGIFRMGVFNMETGKEQISVDHHLVTGRQVVRTSPEENNIIVFGSYMSGYKKTLDAYDENSTKPSQYSISKFKQFYESNSAFALSKYNQDLVIVDSACFISKRGEALEVFLRLNQFYAMDIDNNGVIYCFNSEGPGLIQLVSPSFEEMQTFRLNNRNYRSLPEDVSKGDMSDALNRGGLFSVVYGLFLSEDHIITTFYQNVPIGDRPEGPYYYDVFSKEGLNIHTGTLPFPLFCRDDADNLYIYMKIESKTFFGDDQFYLVKISYEELATGLVDTPFLLNRIEKGSL